MRDYTCSIDKLEMIKSFIEEKMMLTEMYQRKLERLSEMEKNMVSEAF